MAPHLHLITTDAGRTRADSWRDLEKWDAVRLMTLFRERLLGKLVAGRAISKELVARPGRQPPWTTSFRATRAHGIVLADVPIA
jgi:hypothetical protein